MFWVAAHNRWYNETEYNNLVQSLNPSSAGQTGSPTGSNDPGGNCGEACPKPWSTATGDTGRDATLLRQHMQDSGIQFNEGDHAHHIVQSNHSYDSAVKSRQILDKFRIDINDANNGVAIPGNYHHGHGLHSHRGMDWVINNLLKASNRDEALAILRDIARIIKEQPPVFPP